GSMEKPGLVNSGLRPVMALLDRAGIIANVGLRSKPTFSPAVRPFDSREFHCLQTVRSLCDLRTVDIGLRGISLEKSTPELDAPTEIFRTVVLRRRPNAELRTREHLTAGEIDALIDAAKANRYGHRDATMILLAFRHGLRAAEACDLRWDQVD